MGCFQAPRKAIQTRKPLQARKPLPSYTKPLQRQKPRKRIKSHSDNERPVAVDNLDRVFSIYIRLKDAVDNIARCVTCGAKAHYKLMQNGHFISRRKMSVRFDEMNCHVQCQYCNENLGGNLKVYKVFMIVTYGQEAVDELLKKANRTHKMSIPEIEALTLYYKDEVKKLLTR